MRRLNVHFVVNKTEYPCSSTLPVTLKEPPRIFRFQKLKGTVKEFFQKEICILVPNRKKSLLELPCSPGAKKKSINSMLFD